jgi:hypothetical protein
MDLAYNSSTEDFVVQAQIAIPEQGAMAWLS